MPAYTGLLDCSYSFPPRTGGVTLNGTYPPPPNAVIEWRTGDIVLGTATTDLGTGNFGMSATLRPGFTYSFTVTATAPDGTVLDVATQEVTIPSEGDADMALSSHLNQRLAVALRSQGAARELEEALERLSGGAALTAQLTTITPADAEGTPDYAIAAITNTSPFGFASAQEAITLLYVIKNLQVRLAEVEARLEVAGVIVAN